MLTTGERIRRARKKAKLSQAALSQLAGLSRSAVSVIESRSGGVKAQTARALARALGVPIESLIAA